MGLEEFLDNGNMEINKEIDTLSNDPVSSVDTKDDYVSLLSKRKKQKKHTVSVYLDNETLDKMKTLCAREEVSLSVAIETWVVELSKDIVPDKKLIRKFDKTKKGRK